MKDPVLYVYYDVVTENEMEKMKKNSLNSVKGFKKLDLGGLASSTL